MPKIYEQQVSWQPTGTQKIQAAQIQDFISPALENASRAAGQAMTLMRDIGDRKAASEMDAAAQAASDTIKNWSDFSEPEKTQEKMTAAGMSYFDEAMNNMDSATRRRMEMYNPKAREIFALKVQEQAANVSYNYALRNLEANMDSDIGNIINERSPQGYKGVNAAVDSYLAKLQKQLRPADYVSFAHKVKRDAQLGLGEWYISNGQYETARQHFLNDAASGDIDEATRARQVKSLTSLSASSSGSAASTKGDNIMNHLLDSSTGGVSPTKAAMAAGITYNLIDGLQNGMPLDQVPLPQTLNGVSAQIALQSLPIVGGKTYNELLAMDATTRLQLTNKLADIAGLAKPSIVQKTNEVAVALESAGAQAVELDDKGNIKKVTGDLNVLMAAWNKAESDGSLAAMQRLDPSSYNAINKKWGRVINQQKLLRENAINTEGKNWDWVNNATAQKQQALPVMPYSAADAKAASGQKISSGEVLTLSKLPEAFRSRGMRTLTQAKQAVLRIKKREIETLIDDGALSKKQGEYVYKFYEDLSNGNMKYMSCDPSVSIPELNKCLERAGLSPYDNTVPYDKDTERQLNDYSFLIRRSFMSKPNKDFSDYELLEYAEKPGTIGWGIASVAGWMQHQKNMTITEAQALNFARPDGTPVVSDEQFSTALNNVILRHAEELDKPADLTNSSVKARNEAGWTLEGEAQATAMGIPSKVSSDITQGYYFRIATELYDELKNQGVDIEAPTEALKRLAMFVRQGTPEFGKKLRSGKITSSNYEEIFSTQREQAILNMTKQTLKATGNKDDE